MMKTQLDKKIEHDMGTGVLSGSTVRITWVHPLFSGVSGCGILTSSRCNRKKTPEPLHP